jgi:hypothetical protein
MTTTTCDLLLRSGADRDLLWLERGRLRDVQFEYAVVILRLDLLTVDTLRQCQAADEGTV